MIQRKKNLWLKLMELLPFFVALLTVLSAGLATETILDISKYLSKDKLVFGRFLKITYIVLFFCMAYILYRKRNIFFRPRTRYFENDNNPEKRKHLVLFVSHLPKIHEESNGIPIQLQLTNDLHKDITVIEKLKQGTPPLLWKWEMPLRAMRYHSNTLETVTLICSEESIAQVNMFLRLCERYDEFKHVDFFLLAKEGNNNCLNQVSSLFKTEGLNGFDFEDFDTLSHSMWYLLRQFKKKEYSDQEIMIDITGGQKPTSIIGASMTFNLNIKLQYVQTNYPWHVVSYDVLMVPSDTGGLWQ